MSVHHFTTEEKIIENAECPYCQERITKMDSTHHFNMQYRETECPRCERKIQIRVGEGSGHDDFNNRLRKNANGKDLDGVIEEE